MKQWYIIWCLHAHMPWYIYIHCHNWQFADTNTYICTGQSRSVWWQYLLYIIHTYSTWSIMPHSPCLCALSYCARHMHTKTPVWSHFYIIRTLSTMGTVLEGCINPRLCACIYHITGQYCYSMQRTHTFTLLTNYSRVPLYSMIATKHLFRRISSPNGIGSVTWAVSNGFHRWILRMLRISKMLKKATATHPTNGRKSREYVLELTLHSNNGSES